MQRWNSTPGGRGIGVEDGDPSGAIHGAALGAVTAAGGIAVVNFFRLDANSKVLVLRPYRVV